MPEANSLFRGAGVALLSLFDSDGTLLVAETAAFAARLAERGAAGILVAGTTGEFWTLTHDERLELTAAVRAAVPPAVPVLAGVGALNPADALALAAEAHTTGANAALCFTPRGETPSAFLPAIKEAVGDLPLLGYHFPAVGYAPLPVEELADLPIDGVKDSSGDPARLLATSATLHAGVYTGSPLLATLAAALPVGGALLALGNLDPAAAQAAVRGDTAAQSELARLHATLGGEQPPRALKRLAAQAHGTPPATRSPSLAEATAAAAGT